MNLNYGPINFGGNLPFLNAAVHHGLRCHVGIYKIQIIATDMLNKIFAAKLKTPSFSHMIRIIQLNLAHYLLKQHNAIIATLGPTDRLSAKRPE